MSNRDHITIHQLPGAKVVTIYCGNCTVALHLLLPVPLTEIVTASRQFAERHAKCEER